MGASATRLEKFLALGGVGQVVVVRWGASNIVDDTSELGLRQRIILVVLIILSLMIMFMIMLRWSCLLLVLKILERVIQLSYSCAFFPIGNSAVIGCINNIITRWWRPHHELINRRCLWGQWRLAWKNCNASGCRRRRQRNVVFIPIRGLIEQ